MIWKHKYKNEFIDQINFNGNIFLLRFWSNKEKKLFNELIDSLPKNFIESDEETFRRWKIHECDI